MTWNDALVIGWIVALVVGLLVTALICWKTTDEDKRVFAAVVMILGVLSLAAVSEWAVGRNWNALEVRNVDLCFEYPQICDQIDAYNPDLVIDDAMRKIEKESSP